MRFFAALLTLFLATSALHAETFYERFKLLETEVNTLKQEVNVMKGKIGMESYVATPSGDASKIEALEKAIRAIQSEQKSLLLNVTTRPTKTTITPSNEASNDDEEEDDEEETPQTAMTDAQENEEDEEEDEEDAEEIEERFNEIEKMLTEIRRNTNGNHIKINADLRTAVDHISYTMADGTKKGNDALFSNRLWLDFKYAATTNSSFTGQLAYHKLYGQRRGTGNMASLDGFDWVTNTVPSDDTVRVKQAYWFYQNNTFLSTPIPWTFSLGRRPSTNGHLINLRDDDEQSSPLAHFVNVEFDGGSSKFDLSEVAGISGLYVKLCFGRGMTNANENFSATPYANKSGEIKQIDMLGVIVSLYDNGQYSLVTQTVRANNLIDIDMNMTSGGPKSDFYTTGNLNNFTIQFMAEGIGSNLGEFLSDTIFFASYSMSQTDPLSGQTMFGSASAEIGSSYWVGLQVPAFSERGKFGIEFNQGDKYWRSITYAEDTMIGSKIATRGSAYEAYWTEYFDEALSMQLRYTYIDYSHTGSNGFFGGSADGQSGTGTPFTIAEALAGGMGSMVVDNAQDIRFYLRYKY